MLTAAPGNSFADFGFASFAAPHPEGIHGAIWSDINDDVYRQPKDKPLTFFGYKADIFASETAFIEPIGVGDSLPDMPLYVATDGYILVPLQPTYDRAFAAMPRRWGNVFAKP